MALSKKRVERIKDEMRELKIDVSLILGGGMSNTLLERLSGSRSGSVLVIPIEGDPSLIVMPIDFTYSSDNAWVRVVEVPPEAQSKRDWTPVAEEIIGVKINKIGVIAGSLNNIQENWIKKLNAETIDIQQPILEPLFSALDPVEWIYQKQITNVVDIGEKTAFETIKPGIYTNEVAAEIAAAELKAGASGVGYLQVSTGQRSAYSHDSAEKVKIKKGDHVLVDLCPTANGYGSDETRTYLAGKGSEKSKKMINAVNRSVEAVLSAIQPGMKAGELDEISRNVLKDEGFPSYPHTLGHPLSGCSRPALRPNSKHILETGSIFTVEPGIYTLGYGGVRIEENVLITKDGFEVLTARPRIPF